MISSCATVARVPGLGQFTCCSRNHVIDGREIPCDKVVIGNVMWKMLSAKLALVSRWVISQPTLVMTASTHEPTAYPPPDSSAQRRPQIRA